MYIKNPNFNTIKEHLNNVNKFKIVKKNETNLTIVNKETNKPQYTFSFPNNHIYIDCINRIVWHSGNKENLSAIIDNIKNNNCYDDDTFDWRIPEDISYYTDQVQELKDMLSISFNKQIENIFNDFYSTVDLMLKDFTTFRKYMSFKKFHSIFIKQLVLDYPCTYLTYYDGVDKPLNEEILNLFLPNEVLSPIKKTNPQIVFYLSLKTIKFNYSNISVFKPSVYFLIQYAKLSFQFNNTPIDFTREFNYDS